MEIQEVLRAAQFEFTDEDVERIKTAIKRRVEDQAASLLPGDRVVARRDVRPKYLAGRTGTVRSHRGDRVVVLMDECGHYRVSGREWRMNPGSIQPITTNP